MNFTILLFLIVVQTCTSSILFRVTNKNKNISATPSYIFGTVHVPQSFVWPYFSNFTLEILNGSDEYWMEHDFTELRTSKYIYECVIDQMAMKKRARARAKTWSQFLNETSTFRNTNSAKVDNLTLWRQWFTNYTLKSSKYLWRNQTITDDMILDHRIILEGHQNRKVVGSLEALPSDCSMMSGLDSDDSVASKYNEIFARAYNCDLIDEDFVQAIFSTLDAISMEKRNQQMTRNIRKLLKQNPRKKFLFAVGSAHLFGNISIVTMLQKQFHDDYHIEQTETPSPNYPYENCADEEFEKLVLQLKSNENKPVTKRAFPDTPFNFLSMYLL